jgi:hypothetical protein
MRVMFASITTSASQSCIWLWKYIFKGEITWTPRFTVWKPYKVLLATPWMCGTVGFLASHCLRVTSCPSTNHVPHARWQTHLIIPWLQYLRSWSVGDNPVGNRNRMTLSAPTGLLGEAAWPIHWTHAVWVLLHRIPYRLQNGREFQGHLLH